MIREGTLSDIPLCLELGEISHKNLGDWPEFEPEAAENLLLGLIEAGGLFVSKRGMIGGADVPLPYGTKPAFSLVLFWYAEDGQSMKLLKRFEEWARLPLRYSIAACGDRADQISKCTGHKVQEIMMGDG